MPHHAYWFFTLIHFCHVNFQILKSLYAYGLLELQRELQIWKKKNLAFINWSDDHTSITCLLSSSNLIWTTPEGELFFFFWRLNWSYWSYWSLGERFWRASSVHYLWLLIDIRDRLTLVKLPKQSTPYSTFTLKTEWSGWWSVQDKLWYTFL